MRFMPLLAAAVMALASCASEPAQPRLGPDGKPLPKLYRIRNQDEARIQYEMLDGVNALRQASGAQPVQLNAALNAAAATHSRDMSVQNRPWAFGSDGSSPLDRVREGKAHRVDVPDQIFSRVHVEDIASGVVSGFDAPSGAYNLSDDEPAPQNAVIEYAAMLLGMAPPPFVSVDDLSPMARGFYAENRRVANGKAKRVLGWRPRYPDYRLGLRALSATTMPTMPSAPPASASGDQR